MCPSCSPHAIYIAMPGFNFYYVYLRLIDFKGLTTKVNYVIKTNMKYLIYAWVILLY